MTTFYRNQLRLFLFLVNNTQYLLDGCSTSANHILMELFKNGNFNTVVSSDLNKIKQKKDSAHLPADL